VGWTGAGFGRGPYAWNGTRPTGQPLGRLKRQSGRHGGASLDDSTIREFLVTTYPRLVAGVALITGSRAAAEDAVQEALARAWERSERGERIESLPAWVTRVAVNLSKSRLRRMRVEARHREISDQLLDEGGSASDARIDVTRALADLPQRQREVTVLRYYLGLNVSEIAATLELHEGTVKTSLFRARAALAAALGEPVEEENDHVALG
jgi:RNA polymerase sigma-70 factor (ECF subfamily)